MVDKSEIVKETEKEVKVKIGFAVIFLGIMIILGTFIYSGLETYKDGPMQGQNWTYVDSFYFSAMTLTTIGYGDFLPTTDVSKIFTVFYSLFGVGLVLYVLGVIARGYVEKSIVFEQEEVRKLKNLLYRHEIRQKAKNENI